jgi:hypothetical protein
MDIESFERLDIDIEKLTKGAIIGSAFLYDIKSLSQNYPLVNNNAIC